jgi:peptidoglycan/xylan/chitin deacetylase (PgdA/CDA1 family)
MKRLVRRVAEDVLGTLSPARWQMSRKPRLLVLMYHRVLPAGHPDRRTEQPGMYVSPETLDMNLAVAKQHFELVHLDDWVRSAKEGGPLPRMACAVTFDDGWRDNYQYGYPVLLKHRAPALIFLVSGMIGTDRQFWPNRLARLLASMPADATLGGPLGEKLAPAIAEARSRGEWRAQDIDRAIVLAKQFDESRIHQLIDEAQASVPYALPERALLDERELRTMADSGLVRFGSHTRTHYRCRDGASLETLRHEIVDSRAEIAELSRLPVDVFCYPNGDTTSEAVELVSRNYLAAVTTRKGWHVPGADPFRISRVGLHEDIASRPASFLARASGWL